MKVSIVLALALAACNTITPAVRSAIDVTACRLNSYVVNDSLLSEDQKVERLEMTRRLRESVGIHGECPNYGR